MKSINVDTSEADLELDDFQKQFDYISLSEGIEILDRQARKYLGMSGEEFLRKYESGELLDDDYDSNVMRVSMLIPFATPK